MDEPKFWKPPVEQKTVIKFVKPFTRTWWDYIRAEAGIAPLPSLGPLAPIFVKNTVRKTPS